MVRTALLIGIVLAAGCGRLAEHPLVVEAVQEVKANERVAELLGQPVECARTVRGSANETDGIAHLEFEAAGPKAKGSIVVEGKKTRGTWGVTKLEVQPADGEKLSLTADLVARTGTDTPTFDPSAAAKPSAAPPPPGEIEITLPPGPPGQ
jgi:hypothetical protein